MTSDTAGRHRPGTTMVRMAGWLMLLGAATHLLTLAVGGIGHATTFLAGVGIVLAVLGIGLVRPWRWLAALAFLAALAGAVSGFGALRTSGLPDWAVWPMVAVDGLAALVLFADLWRR